MKILYDIKYDYLFTIYNMEIVWRYFKDSSNFNRNFCRDDSITLTLPIEMIEYIKHWQKCMYDNETGMINKPTEYKRDIIVAGINYHLRDDVDTKFHNSFPKSFEIKGENIILELQSDYHEIGFFPEIKQIIRDKKINQILN